MVALLKDFVSFSKRRIFSFSQHFLSTDLVHLSIAHRDGAKKDLQSFVETFFKEDFDAESEDDTKPTILFSSYFEVPSSTKGENLSGNQTGPIYICGGPYVELDYDETIKQAKLLYEKMYPDDEFLPKAPEPEEIIIGDEDATEGGVNLGVLADLVDEGVEVEITENVEKGEEVVETTEEGKAE